MVYKIIKDFNHVTSDHKILILKEGTSIDRKEEESYIIKQGRHKELKIPAVIVESNPEYFDKVDLNSRILNLLKKSKAKTNPKIANELTKFIDEEYLAGKSLVDEDILAIALEACRQQFLSTQEKSWLEPIEKLDWDIDSKGVYKN